MSVNVSKKAEKMVEGKTSKQSFLLGYMYAKVEELTKTELFRGKTTDEVFEMLAKEAFIGIEKRKGSYWDGYTE